ncbi:MAG TPA: peptidoglycan editing factor PgeF [Bacilli bacterium]
MEPFVQYHKLGEPAVFQIKRWMDQELSITAGISSRHGGTSQQEMASLNCALHVNDDANHVISNRNKLVQQIGFPFEAWTCAEQVHGSHIEVVTNEEKGRGRYLREDAFPATDGMVTNCRGVVLTVFFADCVPVYFWDPVAKAVGLVHAGWKGTVLEIVRAAIEVMKHQFGSQPNRIQAAIGPSIGSCCYEVDGAVMDKVRAVLPDVLQNPSIEAIGQGKYKLDLKEVNRQFMIKAGILPTNIEISRLCTSCNTHLFYSHRREEGRTGRMAAWIGMK